MKIQIQRTKFDFLKLFTIIKAFENNPKRSFWIVFAGLFVYQILLIFQGFELCDSGFYATFYQNIFSSPASVESNFPYWFTGIVGGLFVKLFPDSGLLGIRFLGVVNVSAIIYIVYKLLNKSINPIALNIGLIIITISFVSLPTEFFHNNLSSLLFISASYALYEGLNKDNIFLIVICGMLLALNVFTRLPNILDVGLVSIIIIHGLYYKETKFICIKRILIFLAGFAVTLICILGLMKLIGHYDIFLRSLNELKQGAVGNTENSHSFLKMIHANINSYRTVKSAGLFATGLILLSAYFLSLFNALTREKYKWLIIITMFFVLFYFMLRLSSIHLLYYFSLILLCWIICTKELNIKILSWIGLFMLIVMPLGSDGAIDNFGNYSVWIAIPLCINLFITEELTIAIKVDSLTPKKQFIFQLNNYYIKLVLFMFLIIFIILTLVRVFNTSYFDPGSRFYKTYKINSPKAKYIFTTQERASIVNDLLDGIKPFVKEGDYLIAYESIPMIHYLTNTKPFLNSSWLTGMNRTSFLKKIEKTNRENNPLPMVIRQKFETLGSFGVPSDEYISDNRKSSMYVSQEQTRMFNQFLVEHKYKSIWNNTYFVLYSPQIKK